MSFPKKIAILYTEAKREYFHTQNEYFTEKSAKKDAIIISKYINQLKIKTQIFPGNSKLDLNIRKYKPDLVLNLAYSVWGRDYYAATIPALLELLKFPFTGTDFFGFALNCDKYITKNLLSQYGVPVPKYQIFHSEKDEITNVRFPVISKLNEIHCAVEIDEHSISENEQHLRRRLKKLIEAYNQPIIVEEYIAGREFTCMFLDGGVKKVYVAEKVFTNSGEKYNIVTYKDQWVDVGLPREQWKFDYKKYHDPVLDEIILKTAKVIKTHDYGKFDVRMDNSGRYYVIDANANPAFGPVDMEVAISLILETYGVDFLEILERVIKSSLKRFNEPA